MDFRTLLIFCGTKVKILYILKINIAVNYFKYKQTYLRIILIFLIVVKLEQYYIS